MRSVRFLLVGAAILVLMTLAACGGSSSSTAATATQGGGSTPSADEPTDQPEETPGETPGGGTGGTGGTNDLQGIADQLKPPNATQTFNQTAQGIIVTIYSSTDSPDSLKSFYDRAITGAGFKVVSTSTDPSTSSTAIVFAKEGSSSFGGAISISPDPSGGAGTVVSVTIGNS